MFNKLIILAVFAAVSVFSMPVMAEEGAPSISYTAKKQGRVPFQTREETAASSQDETGEVNPADIEPAAGAYESQAEAERASVAEKIKLPRKN
ncbi:MAG: hypothetical protein GC137_07590 [Alphaproteobacteria bacterium]|nr:hypothetical protein [Alphaproteobacteria bacterium]